LAVLDKLPAQSIIDGYKGILDFYVWMGIPVVRSWPRWTGRPRSPAVQRSAAVFGRVARAMSSVDADVQEAARRMADGSPWTWRDCMTALAYGTAVISETFLG